MKMASITKSAEACNFLYFQRIAQATPPEGQNWYEDP